MKAPARRSRRYAQASIEIDQHLGGPVPVVPPPGAVFGDRLRTGIQISAAVLTGYTMLAFALTSDTWRAPSRRMVGNPGDPLIYLWSLAWGPSALVHHLNPFYSTYLNAPTGFNLMWGGVVLPLPALMMWPVTAAFGPVVSFNLLVTLSFSLSAWAMFMALKRISGSTGGAVAGGLVYGFGPYMLNQGLAHVQMTMQVVPPLLLILIHEGLVRQRWRARWVGLGTGALLAGQLMTYTEPLALDGIGIVAAMVPLALVNWRRSLHSARRALRMAAVAAMSGAVMGLPALSMLLLGPNRLIGYRLHNANVFVADLYSFIMPSSAQAFSTSSARVTASHFSGLFAEWDGYLGIPLLVLLTVGVVRFPKNRALWVPAAALMTTAVLSLGPSLHIGGVDQGVALPWAFFDRMPMVDNLLPARLALMTDLFASLLLALIIAALVNVYRRPWQRGAIVAVVVAALVPLFPAVPYPSAAISTPAFFTSADVGQIPDGSTVLVAPYPTGGHNAQPEVWQAEAGMRFRLVGGYVLAPDGRGGVTLSPPSKLGDLLESLRTGGPAPILAGAERTTWLTELRRSGASTVIVGPMAHEDAAVRLFTVLLGTEPTPIGGVYLWHLTPP